MVRQPWMEALRRRLRRSRSRRSGSGTSQAVGVLSPSIDRLENRTLLTVAGTLLDGNLRLFSDADEDVSLQPRAGIPSQLEILVNGVVFTGVGSPLQADQIVSIQIDLGASENTVDLSQLTAATVPNVSQINVTTGNGHDVIIASPDIAGFFNGGDGDDTLIGGGLDDTLIGGDGDDSISGGEGADSIDAGDGNDVVLSDDPIDPTADPMVTPPPVPGNDTVLGGDGDDTITTLGGNDSVIAGSGQDVVESLDGDNTLNGGAGDDRLTSDLGNDVIRGGGGADIIASGAGNDTVNGQGGRDSINGGEGNDLINGNGASDLLTGGGGNDTVVGGNGADNLEGGLGDDCVLGGSGADVLFDEGNGTGASGQSLDTLRGQGGDDTLLSFLGADVVDGGNGNDLIDMRAVFVGINNILIDPEGDLDVTVPPILVTPPPDPAMPMVTPPPVLVQPPVRSTVQFTVTLSAVLPRDVSVDFATFSDGTPTGGSAIADVDYESGSGTVVVPAGSLSTTIDVVILGDLLDESEETFFVNLSNASGAIISDGQGEGRINDDDAPTITDSIDIFLLLDDTGSFSSAGPAIQSAFNQIISDLGTQNPSADFAFGVGRFEAYTESDTNRPFILNQPIISDDTVMFQQAIDAALIRSAPGGGRGEETVIESLFQIATGAGFDGNGDGDTVDDGPAGPFASQTLAAPVGDIAAFPTFMPDLMGDPNGPILPPANPVAMATDGVGFRPGSQHIVLVATDAGSLVHEDDGNATYTGVGGATVPSSVFSLGSSNNPFIMTPNNSGAGIQATINELAMDGIQVIGLGESSFFNTTPRRELEALATLTGAINNTGLPVENNITPGPSADDIQPGGPLYFEVNSNDPIGLADAIVNAIVAASADPVPPSPPPPTPPTAPTGPQNDTITGGSGRDTVFAADTDDLISAGGGRDLINAGGGNDTVYGGGGNDTLNGQDGFDILYGQGGRDRLNGGANEDVFVWAGGGQGQDTADGGDGSDRVIVNGSSALDRFTISQNANDLLVVSDGAASLTVEDNVSVVEVRAGANADRITIEDIDRVTLSALRIDGQAGADRIDASGARIGSIRLRISGGDGNDILTGSHDGETLSGGDGFDLIDGREGNDVLNGNAGVDTLLGGDGDDTLNGGLNNDSLVGSFGNDILSGNEDRDTLRGNEGADTLIGGLGDDLLDGGAAADSLLGQEGRDTLLGAAGNDTLDGGKNDDTLRGHAGADRLTGDDGDDLIVGNDGNDELVGGDGDDTLLGGNGRDGLNGQDGADLIQGNLGEDTLAGGDGNDTLQGGGNDDTLLGELGTDVLNGNSGDDVGATGEGADPPPVNITINESFRITTAILEALDGI